MGLQPLEYTALEKIRIRRPVDRLGFLEEQVSGKRVFDLGALDETAYASKLASDNWLHARLCMRAASVIGIDNSRLVPDEGLDTPHGGRIIRADISELDSILETYGVPDVIVAGELIEHLPDTVAFLASLRANPRLDGVEFVFSTPNAACWHNMLVGLIGRESMHVDHLQVYSYKVLRTIFSRADVELLELLPCYARFPEMIGSSTGIRRAGAAAFQRLVNILEFATPLLSAGWVGVARLR